MLCTLSMHGRHLSAGVGGEVNHIPYNVKMWRVLNLANLPSEHIGKF